MSIIINLQPQRLQPVYNEIIMVLNSTKKTEPRFQYVIDINVSGTTQSRLRISNNLQGFGVVDLHKHIEPFVSFNINHLNTGDTFTRIRDSWTPYSVTLSEEYRFDGVITNITGTTFADYTVTLAHPYVIGDDINISSTGVYNGVQTITSIPTSTSFITDKTFVSGETSGDVVLADGSSSIFSSGAVFTGGTIFGINTSLPWLEIVDWDSGIYNYSTTPLSLNKMLVSREIFNDVTLEDRMWFQVYNIATPSTADIDFLRVFTFNNADVQLGEYKLPNPFTANNEHNRFLQIGVGPYNLTTTTGVTVSSGSLPIFTDDVAYYTITPYNIGDGSLTQVYRFNIKDSCSRFEKFRIIYMDIFGSFLNITFRLGVKKKIRVRRKIYKQNFGSYNSTTNSWGYNDWDRGDTHLDSQITETFTIESDYVNETTGQQIIDMLQSPEVYHLTEDGQLRAINIKTSSLREKTRSRDKLISYKINFTNSFVNTVQRG